MRNEQSRRWLVKGLAPLVGLVALALAVALLLTAPQTRSVAEDGESPSPPEMPSAVQEGSSPTPSEARSAVEQAEPPMPSEAQSAVEQAKPPAPPQARSAADDGKPPTPSETAPVAEGQQSCEACHSDPAFLVTNKKLYDYYQQWSESVHKQEGVTCDECHGGNPRVSDKVAAHGEGVGEEDEDSGVYFKNIPETCGAECHEEILAGFQQSNHFEHVAAKLGEEQGPTCVTCHGSIDVGVLNVNSVEAACVRCHNEETDNHPEHPRKAREILNRFLSISRFYRYITVRVEPDEAKVFFLDMDERLRELSVTWHTFDLEKIDRDTERVLALLKEKRDEIRKRRAEKL